MSCNFCEKLGLASELVPNSGIPLNCANPGSKIRVLWRLREGVCRIRFSLGPNFLVQPLIADRLSHLINIGLDFMESTDITIDPCAQILCFPTFQLSLTVAAQHWYDVGVEIDAWVAKQTHIVKPGATV